jgi:hypothetical protein
MKIIPMSEQRITETPIICKTPNLTLEFYPISAALYIEQHEGNYKIYFERLCDSDNEKALKAARDIFTKLIRLTDSIIDEKEKNQ